MQSQDRSQQHCLFDYFSLQEQQLMLSTVRDTGQSIRQQNYTHFYSDITEYPQCDIEKQLNHNLRQENWNINSVQESLLLNYTSQTNQIEMFADQQTEAVKARKIFIKYNGYVIEKQLYENLLNDFIQEEQQLAKFAILPSKCDEIQRAIYFVPGVCSLQQYLEQCKSHLTGDQAVLVFTSMLEFMFLMKEKGYCHSDIKPQNIQIVPCQKNSKVYHLKIMDLSSLSKEQYNIFTPAFFNNPIRDYDENGFIKFNSTDEKFKNEFYTIIRTFQLVVLGKKYLNIFILQELKGLEQLKQIQSFIKILIHSDKCKTPLLNHIVEFITLQGLEERYTFKELKNLLDHLKNNMTEEQKYFQDTKNIIETAIQKNQISINQIADPLSEFIRIKNYTYQIGSYSQSQAQPFDLLSNLKKIIQQPMKRQNILIIGDSGAGKTLLLTRLFNDLQQEQFRCNIVLVRLRDLSDENSQNNLFNVVSNKLKEQTKMQTLLILLDGLDEIKNSNLKIKDMIKNGYNNNYKSVKIVATICQDSATTQNELDNTFKKLIKIYIAPFNSAQKQTYIETFLQTCALYKNYMHEVLDKTQDYLQIISTNKQLSKLCKVPCTLSLVIWAMPAIIQKINQKDYEGKQKKFTKYKVYKIFLADYTRKQTQIIFSQKYQYKLLCIKKYRQVDFENNLFQDLYSFNQQLSWYFLKQQNLQIKRDQINTKFNDIAAPQDYRFSELLDILLQISPFDQCELQAVSYIHKSFQQFYIVKSIIQETLNVQCKAIDQNNTMLNQAYLILDTEILSLIAQKVAEMSVASQYLNFFETWYQSILMTRRIKNENINGDQLNIIGSNCINLLASLPQIDLTNRDFSFCAIPYANLQKRDLSGCVFDHASMQNCVLTEANLHKTSFIGTDLSNLTYDRYKDFVENKGPVSQVAFSADGKFLASVGGDSKIRLWNFQMQKQLAILCGHTKRVVAVTFSADCKYLASGSFDKLVKIWNLETLRDHATLRGHSNTVKCIAFSTDGKCLATGGSDWSVKLWNVQKKKIITTLKSHVGSIISIVFSQDSKYFASCSEDTTVKLWTIQSQIELVMQYRHKRRATSVAFSPDGQYLASGGTDMMVKLWNVELRQEVNILRGHSKQVSSVAFSPNGNYLASGSHDSKVKLWSVASMKELATFQEQDSQVNFVAFSSDSNYLASCYALKTIRLWNVRPHKEFVKLDGHSGEIRSVAFSPDSKYLASGSIDATVKVWSVQSHQKIMTLRGHSNSVNSIAFSSYGQYLASGSADKTIKLWSMQSQQEVVTLKGHRAEVKSIAFSANGQILASADHDKSLMLWSMESFKVLATLRGHRKQINSIYFSPSCNIIASASNDKNIYLWNTQTYRQVFALQGHQECVKSIAISSDCTYLASGSDDCSIKLWSIEFEKELSTLTGHSSSIYSVAFSPDCKHLLSSSEDKTIKLWNIQQNKQLISLRVQVSSVFSVVFSADGKYFATGGSNKMVNLWSFRRCTEVVTMQDHKRWLSSVIFSPSGKHLASGSADRTVRIWCVETKQMITVLRGHSQQVSCVTFSPDGKYLASGSYDTTIKLWSAESYQEVTTLQGHTQQVSCVAFSPDGKYLASSSWDKTVKLWYVRSYQEAITQQEHENKINSVAFSPDSKYLAYNCDTSNIKIWSIYQQKEVITLKGHTKVVNQVLYSPDGKYLASVSSDNGIKLWSSNDFQEVITLQGDINFIIFAAFSPDAKYLAYGNYDRTVKIWSVKSRKVVGTLLGHSGGVNSIAFSPNGKYLASGSNDNMLKIWDIQYLEQIQIDQLQEKSEKLIKFDSYQPAFNIHIPEVCYFESEPSHSYQISNIKTLSLNQTCFNCRDSKFIDCIFKSQIEAKSAQKIFEQFGCRQFYSLQTDGREIKGPRDQEK